MAERKEPIVKGETAPDFTLKDQHGTDFRLSDQRGKKVLLAFHPLAFTGYCNVHMLALEVTHDVFTGFNTVPVGISVDPPPAKADWAEHLKLKNLRILSDFWPHGEVSRAYGMFRDEYGTSKRGHVLIDESGKVAWVKVYRVQYLPDVNEIIELIKS